MIRLCDLTLARAGRNLLEGVNLTIEPGERIGLLGRNGCGKSTLIAAMAGDLGPERGDIVLPRLRIARLSQNPPSGQHSLLDHVLRADHRRAQIEQELAQLEHSAPRDDRQGDATIAGVAATGAAQGERIAQLHAEFDEIEGWSAPARAARLLDGLGFSSADHGRAVDSLSGGWKMRLDLARVLMAPSDLLLLDEPTNHLDLDAVLWLERWLNRYQGTVLVVSHDRDFVDAFATAVLNFETGTLQRYAGGWSDFERQQAERRRLQRKIAQSQEQQIARLEQFINRFRAQATKARQAQSRVKALERLERIVVAADDSAARMCFDSPDQVPEQIASLEATDCGYPAVLKDQTDPTHEAPIVIVGKVQLDLRRGDRIGVLGRNGAGKSTLIRTLVGDLPALQGKRQSARGLRIGYFAQRQVELLDPDSSPLEHFKRAAPNQREQVLREYLAGFDFKGEQVMAPTGPFSGGEKARLALALIAWTRPQLLVLDEPTNHLDASARDALTAALAEFDGAILLVSHDRSLLRATVDRFVIVADGQLAPFDGDLDDYRQWLASRESGVNTVDRTDDRPGLAAATQATDRRQERRTVALSREVRQKQLKPLKTRLVRIEGDLTAAQASVAVIDEQLGNPEFLRCGPKVVSVQQQRADLTRRIDELEDEWLEITAAMEALESDSRATPAQ